VAGLTPEEAAGKLRTALVSDLFAVRIGEVKVVKVQASAETNAGAEPRYLDKSVSEWIPLARLQGEVLRG